MMKYWTFTIIERWNFYTVTDKNNVTYWWFFQAFKHMNLDIKKQPLPFEITTVSNIIDYDIHYDLQLPLLGLSSRISPSCHRYHLISTMVLILWRFPL